MKRTPKSRAEYQRKYVAELKARGLCIRCRGNRQQDAEDPSERGTAVFCPACRRRHQKYEHQRFHQKQAQLKASAPADVSPESPPPSEPS